MKIAIVSQSYPPMLSGAALFSKRLAEHFSESSHEVLVLAASDKTYPYQVERPHLREVRLPSHRNPFRSGQRFTLWPHRKIMQYLNEFSPELIHLHDPLQIAASCLAYARPRSIPVVLTIHQLPWFVSAYLPGYQPLQHAVEYLLWRYARWILTRCTCSVVATQTISDVIEHQTGYQPSVISCGIDLSVFSPEQKLPDQSVDLRLKLRIPPQAPIILHVGRLDKDKQVERVVQAAAMTMCQTSAHLLIVGDGTEKSRLMELCKQLGIEERSHFPGFVSKDEGLPELYRVSNVFVTASEIETQGIVLLEAAASGLPLIAMQATCLHEIVHDGKNGYLLSPGDQAGMAERMTQLIQHPERAVEMGQMNRQIVIDHAEKKTFFDYEAVYQSACQEIRIGSPLKKIHYYEGGY